MTYKPKFKQKELFAIAKKMHSCEVLGEKIKEDPARIEFFPERNMAKVYWYLNADGTGSLLSKDATYYNCDPIEPYEIGYKKWIEKIQKLNAH